MRSNQSSRALRATALFLLAGTLHTAAYAVPESNVPAAVDGIAAIQQMRTVKGVNLGNVVNFNPSHDAARERYKGDDFSNSDVTEAVYNFS